MLPKITQPIFQIEIPSTKQKAHIRPMLVKEEKILLVAKESAEPGDIFTAIKQVCDLCLNDANIDDLTLFDLEYIFLKIRAVSISNIVKLEFKDNEDNKIYPVEIDLDKDVSIKYGESISKDIVVSPTIIIRMKNPPAKIYNKKILETDDKSTMFDDLIIDCIDSIMENGVIINLESQTQDELRIWINELPVKVYEKVREFFSNVPTLFCEVKYTNSKGSERKIKLSSLNDFFTLL